MSVVDGRQVRRILTVLVVFSVVAGSAPAFGVVGAVSGAAGSTASVSTVDADDCSDAPVVSGDGTQNGTLDTSGDTDAYKVQLSEGSHLDMSASVPAAEDSFVVELSSTNDGEFTVKNVSNANGGTPFAMVNRRISGINGGIPAEWELWAETDLTVCVQVSDGDQADYPYEWSIGSEHRSPTGTDQFPASASDAPVVSPNSTQSDLFNTPDDTDSFKVQLDEGDRLTTEALVPSDAEDFEVDITSVNDGEFTVKNVSNANGGTPFAMVDRRISDINGGIPAEWELWAETDGVFVITVFDDVSATVPYEWNMTLSRDTPAAPDTYPESTSEAPVVSPNDTQSDLFNTPDDTDSFKVQLDEGDRLTTEALVPSDAEDFEVDITSVNDGEFTVKNVSNANGGTPFAMVDHRISDINGGVPASWQLQAETDGVFVITVFDDVSATVPYEWQVRTQLNGPLQNQPPTAALSVATPDPRTADPVSFDASASADLDGTISSYRWDFGDGTANVTTDSPETTHQYDSPGNYTVEVTVVDDEGATATATATVAVREPSGGSGDHESGVSQDVFEAAAGADGQLSRDDVIRTVTGYIAGGAVGGVSISRTDVVTLVQYYILN